MKNSNDVRLNKDGRIVIMQVSDTQDMVHVRKAMVKMLDAAYDSVKPDLVLFTGDNILGNHLLDARIGSRQVAHGEEATYERMEKSLAHIIEPLEKRGITYSMIFGNHDDMNCVSKERQAEIFRRNPNCLPMNTDDDTVDCDTHNIPILSNDGKRTVFNLYMLDCAWRDHEENRTHEEVKKETVEWYRKTGDSLREKNGGKAVKSLMFLHIPLPQQLELCSECSKDSFGAIKAGEDKYIRLDASKARGVMGEPPCVCKDEFGLFDEVKARGDVMAVITGHDHQNCFEGEVDGVKMIQTPCASFRCYGNYMRGVRVFILDESDPDIYRTFMVTYDDLFGKTPASRLRYIWDADDMLPRKTALLACAGTALAAVTALGIKLLKK